MTKIKSLWTSPTMLKDEVSIHTYTIYVHYRKIYNLFVRALLTARKVSLCGEVF